MAIEVLPGSGGVEVVVTPGGIVSGGVVVTPGGGGSGGVSSYEDLTDVPTTFPPEAHTHDHGALTGLSDDDHTQYQKESEKGNPGGYATLDGSGLVPDNQIPTGIARNTEVDGAIDDHEAAVNPHPVYLTQAEADALYTGSGEGGVTDHGALTGLSDDDHTQYHTDTRGDARYTPLAHVGTGGTAHANAIASGAAGFLTGSDKAKLDGVAASADATPDATETLKGKAEIATQGETDAGTDDTRFVTPLKLATYSGLAGGRTLVSLGSNVTNSTSTYADVTGLGFPVSSGGTYRFYFLIWIDTQATTTGFKISINGPTASYLQYRTDVNTSNRNDTTYEAMAVLSASLAAGNHAVISGIVKPSASGTLIARFASEAPGTNNQVTVVAGSSLEWW